MTVDTQEERLGFEAEVRQLLDLMVHSLYSNKEIFLRELISNASDAVDKLRFEALSDNELYEGEGELKIRVACDAEARTVTVSDNGIGMSRQEVIDNLGTIAKSGTREFFQSLTGDSAVDAQLIGQFGVGFYSSFIVAERVTVKSRRAGLGREEGVEWSSDGKGEYRLRTIDRARRGTEVVLELREGEEEFLDGARLRAIIKKYSDHISWPILMRVEGSSAEEETVNSATALWSRAKSEIGDAEYEEFYKHIAHDFEAPLARVHSRVEGNLEYTSLLFVPAHAPFDLWDRQARRGLKLYVRRVFIMDDAEQLMPAYLRFVRGVIDSPDLPLNISREILQQSKQIESIRAGSVKKVLGLLEGLAKEEPENYHRFWDEFGRVLKEGLIEDPANRETLAKLLRFASTASGSEEERASLDDYVGRMADHQDKIYYLTAANYRTAKGSPQLELFENKGVEVLLLTDDIDEIAVMHLGEHDGKPLHSIARGDLDLSDLGEEEAPEEPGEEGADAFLARVQACLEDRVKAVRITQRLISSPACLVADEHDMSGRLERLLRAAGQPVPGRKPIMELNPRHAMVKALREESDEQRFSDWAHILFDESLLVEGAELADPSAFVSRVNKMLSELVSSGPAGGASS